MKHHTTHTTREWYRVYRSQGTSAKQALQYARIAAETDKAIGETLDKLSPSSRARVQRYFDAFIRSEDVDTLRAERSNDFINEPERAERCHKAAEHGCDGSTHYEVIQDWRDALSERFASRGVRFGNGPERFKDALDALIDSCEQWHSFNGSLFAQLG